MHPHRPSVGIALIFLLPILISCGEQADKGASADPPSQGQPKITICGAYALAPFIQACAEDFARSRPGAEISVIPMSHDSALQMLYDRRCDVAMISRPLKPDEEDLFAIPVAKTGVVFVFNRHNPLRSQIMLQGLTISDLQNIYTSREMKTWDAFLRNRGATDLHHYYRADPSGVGEVVARFLFLEPGEITGVAVVGENEMIRAVCLDTLGLGFCNVNEAFDLNTGQKLEDLEFLPLDLNMSRDIEDREQICTQLDDFLQSICMNTYPHKLSRNLYLVAPEKPENPLLLDFLNFMITTGQNKLAPMGYTPLPASLARYNRYLLD